MVHPDSQCVEKSHGIDRVERPVLPLTGPFEDRMVTRLIKSGETSVP